MERSSRSQEPRIRSLIKLRYYNIQMRWDDIKEDIWEAYKEHVTTLFWIRLGIRICLGFLYLALSVSSDE